LRRESDPAIDVPSDAGASGPPSSRYASWCLLRHFEYGTSAFVANPSTCFRHKGIRDTAQNSIGISCAADGEQWPTSTHHNMPSGPMPTVPRDRRGRGGFMTLGTGDFRIAHCWRPGANAIRGWDSRCLAISLQSSVPGRVPAFPPERQFKVINPNRLAAHDRDCVKTRIRFHDNGMLTDSFYPNRKASNLRPRD